ncbi:Ig-like domain-containing protein [Terriglobus saanensis]|uniref:Ig domain protein group 2 domain protein n=1 Tax=Terriglobus saanensis (strain ATCC BAA-1853 / DSM 23119 / SP1PR4) TaxID=401053 RepID=E8UZC7_TERSS|nr:Ig-like domain-containing protein [Terriglobus saanensis]ADV83207.1 Ig domain protein group 2 domain protein [Terriglobus saanensis SP1PR4]
MDVRRGLVAVSILVFSALMLIYCSFGNKVASAQVVLKANLPTGTGANGSNYNYQVLPGSQRQISVKLTGGTVNLVNWSVSSSTGGATAVLDRGSNAIGVTNVTIGPTAGSCTVSGTLGAYSVNSPATVTVQAQSVDDPSQVASFLFKVCAPTTTVKISPGYQQAYIGQPVELQSFVIGNTNEAGTWTITSNPKNAGKILDNNKRDTVFSATAVGRYALTYTSAADPTKTSTAYVYVAGPQPSYGLVTANLTMAVPCATDPAFTGKTYDVGPSQPYKTINAVPFTTWSPGSIVRIHNEDTTGRSPTTYHETARIAGQGTASQPLMFCGVPDGTGQLPVMDGANSTSAVGNTGSQEYAIINVWGPNGYHATYTAGSNGPDYTIVSGIRIINGRNTYSFTPAGTTGTQAFNDFCSGIRVKNGQFVTLIGNDIQNDGNGIFIQNNSAGGFSQVTLFTTIRGNRIRDAGISGGPGINNAGSHGIYTQAYYPVIEANRIESLVLNSGGDLIKDRGLESIHRYNYAVTSEGGYLVGMESATDAQPYNAFEPWLGGTGETTCSNATYCDYENTITADQVAAFSESLEKIYMYGNIYSSRANQFLANFKLSDSGGAEGYVWSNQTEMGDHLGTTYFYQNTVDSPPYAVFGTLSGANNGSDPDQQPLKPTVFAANNIFYLPKTGSVSIFSLTRNASIVGKWQTNLFNKGTVDNTLPINGKPATNLTSVLGWQNWNDNLQYPGALPINGHNSGITPAGTGNFLETDKQNHQPYNPVTYAPVAGAGATGKGTPITDPSASLLPVRFQYIVDTGALIPRTTLTTIGAVDTGNQPSLTSIAVRPDTTSFLSQTGTCNYGPAAFDYPGACLPSRMGAFYTPIPLRVLGTFSDGSTVDVSPLVAFSNSNLTFYGNSAFTMNDFAPVKGLISASLNNFTIQIPYAFDGATAPAAPTATITSVVLAPSSLTLTAGGNAQLTARALYNDGSSAACSASSWTSSQPRIASVSNAGVITAMGPGTASVTAACGSIVSSPATLTVNAAQRTITSVNIVPGTVALTVGGTSQLVAMATYSDSSVASCAVSSWTSIQPLIASVSGGGTVVAIAKGTASITAVCGNVGSTPAIVTVSPPKPTITSVHLKPGALTLTVGGTSGMSATATYSDSSTASCSPSSWTSSKPLIASVSGGGAVTAISKGTAFVTAVCSDVSSVPATITVNPPAPTITSVSITPGSLALTVGGTSQLTTTATYSDASVASCAPSSWTSAKPLIAFVSGGGTVAAIAKGTASVTAICSNVSSAPAIITVSPPKPTITLVTLTPSALVLTVGGTSQLTATATYSDASMAACSPSAWTSLQPLIASVSGSGALTAIAKGTASITAVCGNIGSVPAIVTVSPPKPTITSVNIAPGALALTVGGTSQLLATATYSDASTASCSPSWTSAQPLIASVSSGGAVSAIAKGTASIIAVCGNISSSPAIITVSLPKPTITSVNITPGALALTVSGTSQLVATATYSDTSVAACSHGTWTSAQPLISSVSSGGTVTAIAKGTASITAACENVSSAPAIVTVSPPTPTITSVNITPGSLALTIGDVSQLVATATYSDASTSSCSHTTWTSIQPLIASVSGGGAVTAIAKGTASVTAVCSNVSSAPAVITVSPPKPIITSVSITPSALTLTVGDTSQLVATATYSDATTSACTTTWSSSIPSKASVSGSGLITAIAKGTTVVSVTCNNIASAPVAVTVSATKPTVASVMVTPGSLALTVGDTSALMATETFSDSTTATCTATSWNSSTPLMASISTSGLVTAIAKGTAVVTAVCDSVASPPVAVTVSPAKATITAVRLTPSSVTLNIGAVAQLTATATYSDGSTAVCSTPTWNSTAPLLASVSSSGLVAAISAGTITVSAVCGGITSSPAALIVSSAAPTVTSITITPATTMMELGTDLPLVATAIYSDTTTKVCTTVTWLSSSPDIATVSNIGLVSAVAVGNTNLTATCQGLTSPPSNIQVQVVPITHWNIHPAL